MVAQRRKLPGPKMASALVLALVALAGCAGNAVNDSEEPGGDVAGEGPGSADAQNGTEIRELPIQPGDVVNVDGTGLLVVRLRINESIPGPIALASFNNSTPSEWEKGPQWAILARPADVVALRETTGCGRLPDTFRLNSLSNVHEFRTPYRWANEMEPGAWVLLVYIIESGGAEFSFQGNSTARVHNVRQTDMQEVTRDIRPEPAVQATGNAYRVVFEEPVGVATQELFVLGFNVQGRPFVGIREVSAQLDTDQAACDSFSRTDWSTTPTVTEHPAPLHSFSGPGRLTWSGFFDADQAPPQENPRLLAAGTAVNLTALRI